jgi:hypothetical protein
MMTRSLIALSLGGLALAAAAAVALEPSGRQAGPPAPSATNPAPISGVSFQDPDQALAPPEGLTFGARTDTPLRFRETNQLLGAAPLAQADAERRLEFAITAPSRVTGLGVDLGVAPRASFAVDEDGRLARAGAGAEVRIGQGLEGLVDRWESPTWDAPAWYFFAASDGQALAWSPERAANVPGARGNGLRWQDRVEVGDFQAGVSLEAGGLQASLSYVQRDVSSPYGSTDDDFAGVTVTWDN